MKVLILYGFPPSPDGLAIQGYLLHKGLKELGVDVYSVHLQSPQEKQWYYRWFKPDLAIGIGYWGHTPHLVMHTQRYGVQPVPWLVADGYIANYQKILEELPLILVTSNWVKKVYIRDGLSGKNIEVLPVGCDTDSFVPREKNDPKVAAVREIFGVAPDQIMILTIGGDAASKGAREVMKALAINDKKAPHWKYVCKVLPRPRTERQNALDLKLAEKLGIEKKVIYTTNILSRNFIPYLLAACDIYAAPSRQEGFGMIHVEAAACGKPVIGTKATGMLDTLVHGQNALLASVEQEIKITETTLGYEAGFETGRRVVFERPKVVDYRASVSDIANYLMDLMQKPDLRKKMGRSGRERALQKYDYRVIAKKFIGIISEKLGIA